MPYKDPEVRRAKAREYTRAYRARNRDKVNGRQREYRAQNPERERESQRQYRERNRDMIRERNRPRSRAYYANNREPMKAAAREYRLRNGDEIRRREREKYWSGGQKQMRAWRLMFYHGMRPEDWAAMWDAQQGLCYLCSEELGDQRAVIEHDHSCCPPESSCRICRRGLAHSDCNSSIGMARDDPARLRRMADALEAAQAIVEQRKAEAGEEIVLFAI